MAEYRYLIELIEGQDIPIEVNHWDTDPRNMMYNRETGEFWLVDYENVNTEIFTHDLARYFIGATGVPADFGKLPSDDRMKQFLKSYMEEKLSIQGRPLSEMNEDKICQVLQWTKVSILFICYMFAVGGPVWTSRCKNFPEHIDLYEASLHCFKHYYRLKEELLKNK